MVEARRCLWLALIRLDCGHRSMHRSSVSMIEIDLKMWGRSRIDRAQWRFVLQEIFHFTSVNKISVYKAYTLVRTRSERLRRKKRVLERLSLNLHLQFQIITCVIVCFEYTTNGSKTTFTMHSSVSTLRSAHSKSSHFVHIFCSHKISNKPICKSNQTMQVERRTSFGYYSKRCNKTIINSFYYSTTEQAIDTSVPIRRSIGLTDK